MPTSEVSTSLADSIVVADSTPSVCRAVAGRPVPYAPNDGAGVENKDA